MAKAPGELIRSGEIRFPFPSPPLRNQKKIQVECQDKYFDLWLEIGHLERKI